MPSLAMYPLSPPTDSKEYEKIIRDYCEKKFGGNVYLFGRSGQRQYGVDVVSEHLSRTIGVQCKDYSDTIIKEKDIDDMISLAETFEPMLDLFIIAIAQKTDANMQRYVMVKSQERVSRSKFPVAIIYWEEVENYIKNNPIIFNKYYGFLYNCKESIPEEQVLVSDINTLRVKFLELYCRFKIRDVILSDVFVGIPCQNITNYDCFAFEIQCLVHNSCILQETDMYQNLKVFLKELDEYVGYIGTLVEINKNNIYTIVNSEIRKNRECYEMIIDMLRTSIIQKFLTTTGLQEF